MKKKAKLIMGVDIGAKGAIVTMQRSGRIWQVMPIPPDPYELKKYLEGIVDRILFARVEEVGPQPIQGVKAAWGFGRNYERILMAFVMLEIRHECRRPQEWQKQLGIPPRRKTGKRKEAYPAFKKRLVQVAKRMYPNLDSSITQHTADAVLIAESCRREYLGKGE